MKSYSLLFLTGILCLFSCNDDPIDDTPSAEDPYANCCGNQPLVLQEQGYSLFLPSAFTPNGDGINDVFFPSVDDGVAFLGFELFNLDGEKIYETNGRISSASLSTAAWDGTLSDGSDYEGRFTVFLNIQFSDSTTLATVGNSCAVQCSDAQRITRVLACGMPDQSPTLGEFDASISSQDNTCLGR